jgi:hypothetical protein
MARFGRQSNGRAVKCSKSQRFYLRWTEGLYRLRLGAELSLIERRMVRRNLFKIVLLMKVASLPKKYLPGQLQPRVREGIGRGRWAETAQAQKECRDEGRLRRC